MILWGVNDDHRDRHPAGQSLGCAEIVILFALVVVGWIAVLYLDSVISGFQAIKTK